MALFDPVGVNAPASGFHTYSGPRQLLTKKGEAQAIHGGPSAPYHKSGLAEGRRSDLKGAIKDAKKAGSMGIVNTAVRAGTKIVGAVTGTSAILEPAVAAIQFGLGMMADKKAGGTKRQLRDAAFSMTRGGAQEATDKTAEASLQGELAAETKKTEDKNKWLDPINKTMDAMDYANMAKAAMHTATTATAGAKDAFTGMREVSTPAKSAVETVGLQDTPGFRQMTKVGMDPQSVATAQLAADKAHWAGMNQAPARGFYGGVEGGSMLQQDIVPSPEIGAVTVTPGYEGAMKGLQSQPSVTSGVTPTLQQQTPDPKFKPPTKESQYPALNNSIMRNALSYNTWGGNRGRQMWTSSNDLVRKLMSAYQGGRV